MHTAEQKIAHNNEKNSTDGYKNCEHLSTNAHPTLNALNTLWVCKKAINPKHEGVHYLCHCCYLKKSNGMNQSGNCTTRGRQNKMKTVDDQEKGGFVGSTKYCDSTNHHLHRLGQYVDSLYFLIAYKLKIKNNNKDDKKSPKFAPFSCSECGVE